MTQLDTYVTFPFYLHSIISNKAFYCYFFLFSFLIQSFVCFLLFINFENATRTLKHVKLHNYPIKYFLQIKHQKRKEKTEIKIPT